MVRKQGIVGTKPKAHGPWLPILDERGRHDVHGGDHAPVRHEQHGGQDPVVLVRELVAVLDLPPPLVRGPFAVLQRFEEHGLETLLVLLGRTPAPDGPDPVLAPSMALQPCPVHLAALRHGPAAGLAHGRFFTVIHAHPTRIPIRFVAISGENPSKHVTRPTNDAVPGVPQRGGCKTRMVVVW